jgi:hypothetical protein
MATEDNLNPNLFGTNNNQEEDEEEEALLAAQDVRMGAGGFPALDSNIVAQVPGIQNIRNPGAFDPANIELNRPIMSAGTAGRDERTTPFEFASQGISSAVEGLRDVVGTESVSMDEYRAAQATQAPSAASTFGATPSVTPPVETPSVGAQEQVQTIQQGAPDSPQANFAARMSTGEALTPQEVQDAQAFAASMGTTFDPATGYSREAFENAQPLTPSQFMRYEDSPGQRTEQFVDEQGRMRFRPTQEALQLQGQGAVAQPPVNGAVPPVTAQPPAAALSSFEQDSLSRQQRIGGTGSYEGDSEAREARVRANERQPGENQSEADTRAAQGRTTGGQTVGMSFDDAKRRAQAQLAARGITDKNRNRPSASMVNDLARGIQAGEPERLAELETKRAKDAADLEETNTKMGFEPRLIDVGGEKAMELSPGYFQRIAKDKPNKTGLQETLGNLQDDLKSGRLTQEQHDIAVGNATNIYIGLKEPSTKTGGATGAVSSIIDDTIAAAGGEETTPSEFKTGEVREQGGKKFRFDGTNWNEL